MTKVFRSSEAWHLVRILVGTLLVLFGPAAGLCDGPKGPLAAGEITGWQLKEGPEHLPAERLFDYLDGGADPFLRHGCLGLWIYTFSSIQDAGHEVVVEIYEFPSASGAEQIRKRLFPGGPRGAFSVSVVDVTDGVAYATKGAFFIKAESIGGVKADRLRDFFNHLLSKMTQAVGS